MNKNKGLNRNYTTTVPYGPATGVSDPGRQPIVDDTPYTGDHGPGGTHQPGYVPCGPATGKTHQDKPAPAPGTPFEGDRGPDGAYAPEHVAGGPGHDSCEHE